MRKHKLLIVKWIDSRREASTSIAYKDDLLSFPCAIIETIGYGYRLKDRIVLATEYYPELPDIQSEQYRTIYSIPNRCVLKVTELEAKSGNSK